MMSAVKKQEFFTSPNLVAKEPIEVLMDNRYGISNKELKALKVSPIHIV